MRRMRGIISMPNRVIVCVEQKIRAQTIYFSQNLKKKYFDKLLSVVGIVLTILCIFRVDSGSK